MKSLALVATIVSVYAQFAFATTLNSGGTQRTLTCSSTSQVYHAGNPERMRKMDPQFFNWDRSEERLFKLKTGECIHLPFWVDDAQSLGLSFLAPMAEVNQRLKEHGLEAIPVDEYEKYGLGNTQLYTVLAQMTAVNGKDAVLPTEFSKSALLWIGGNDFANTPAGAIRPSHVFTYVKPNGRCYLSKDMCAKPAMFFWKYYVNTLRAKYAGEETWGLQKKMGSGTAHYQGAVKSYAYFDADGIYKPSSKPNDARVYGMKWNQEKNPVAYQLVKGQPIPGVSMPNGSPVMYPGYDAVILGVTQAPTTESMKLKTNPGQTYNLVKWGADGVYYGAFNQQTDEWTPNFSFDFLAPMKGLSYLKPFFWQYLSAVKVIYYTDEPPSK